MKIFVLWKVSFSIARLNYFSNEYFISCFFIEYTSTYVLESLCGRHRLAAVLKLSSLPPALPLQSGSVIESFSFLKCCLKVQSNNIIQQCFPCHYFVDSFLARDGTVYFSILSRLAPVKSVRLMFSAFTEILCSSRWGLFFCSSYLSCSVFLLYILTVWKGCVV